ncbi:hypothetical protein WME75_14260 [Sorangium sp. So ce1014]|uniref:hypothetical protein n=1 Tax=Sorangium sp. So ce1014 TaxID=3133326 RepID=UPI003F5DE80B
MVQPISAPLPSRSARVKERPSPPRRVQPGSGAWPLSAWSSWIDRIVTSSSSGDTRDTRRPAGKERNRSSPCTAARTSPAGAPITESPSSTARPAWRSDAASAGSSGRGACRSTRSKQRTSVSRRSGGVLWACSRMSERPSVVMPSCSAIQPRAAYRIR